MRRRLRVWTRTIIGGLVVLQMVAVAGCADAEPNATGEPTVPASAQVATPKPSVTTPPSPPVDPTEIEVVYASPAYPQLWGPGEYDPLWGDLDADAPIIDRLLRAIEGGTPVEMVGVVKMAEELTRAPHSNLVMNLRFRDGTTWSVRHAIRCDLTSEGKKTNCLILADHWEVLPRNEVVASTALTEWFERVQEYMPTVKYYEVPDPITLGEPFAISGAGYHEGDRVELSIEFIDESVMSLGDVPLDYGAFHWEGEIPETAHPGLVNITMRGFEGTERARGTSIIRHSVTVIGDVDVVYASQERQPRSLRPGEYDPLWGDLDGDVSAIEQLLKAITMGTVGPVRAEEGIAFSDHGLAVNVRFRDGTIWSVKQVIKCNLTPEGRMTNCGSVPDQYHWNLLHPNQITFSRLMTDRALTEWFEQVREYMPRVEFYEVPDPITLGKPFTISGAGYHEGDRVELSVKFSDQSVMPLGEVPLDHGAFRWEGVIPKTTPSGPASFTMQVLEGAERVWGATISSVNVLAPTAAGVTTELPVAATWILDSLDGQPLIEESVVTLRIDENQLDGVDGCNAYSWRSRDGAPIANANGRFAVPGVDRTEMLCPEPEGVMDQADAYVSALMQGETYRVVDKRLESLDGEGAARLVLIRRAPLPGRPIDLEGTAWRLLIEDDALDGVRVPTLAFLDDRLVTGATACRSYVATYRASEGALGFPGKAMLGSSQSGQSCGKNERTLEGEFGDLLTWAREYSVDEEGGSSLLRIWSIRGKTLTFEPLPPIVEDIRDAEWSLVAFVERRQLDPGTWGHRTTDVLDGTEVTIGFDEYGLGGLSGCNSYGGPAKLEAGSITVDAHLLHLTAMGCVDPDGVLEQEEGYFALINRLLRYGIYGDNLFLKTADDVFLLFRAK